MSNLYFNATPAATNLIGSTNTLITQPQLKTHDNIMVEEEGILHGGSKKSPKKSPLKKSPPKKVKLIDTYTKVKLVKIAKKNEVSLKARDGKPKNKEQLFASLKRKNLV